MAQGDGIRRVLSSVKTKKESGDGWLIRCPAHDDSNPSCHVKQGRKGALIQCYAGCENEAIVRALGLEMHDLFDDDGGSSSVVPVKRPATPAPKRQVVSVKTMAEKFGHDEKWLKEVPRIRQIGRSVGVPYFDESGAEMFVRRRVILEGKGAKYIHPKGKKLSLYGLDRLPSYREEKVPALMFVEGETDCWALWRVGVSALGVPGANAVKTVKEEHIEGIKKIYIHQEPGAAGETFQLKLGERLEALGFDGPIKVMTSPGAKDPAQLWAEDPDRFPSLLRRAISESTDWSSVSIDDMIISMDTVERRDVTFLWEPYIPEGMVTIVGGKPGLGKSFWSCALTSAITAGKSFPGNPLNFKPGNVLMFNAEDDPGYVLRGRLEDQGADLSRCKVFNLADHSFKFDDPGFGKLRTIIERTEPRLIVFDPIVSFTGSKINISRQNEVRGVLQPLVDIARKTGVPVVLVAHVSKGSSSSAAIDSFMGSVDFSAAPRSAMILYPDPQAVPGHQSGILAHAKHNLSKSGPSLKYSIIDNRFVWQGETTMSATDLQGTMSAPNHERSAIDQAVEFLRTELGDGMVDSKQVTARARTLGITESTLSRARLRIGVGTRRVGFGPKAKYKMFLTDSEDARDAEESVDDDPALSADTAPI